jgi:hypothetical protein
LALACPVQILIREDLPPDVVLRVASDFPKEAPVVCTVRWSLS